MAIRGALFWGSNHMSKSSSYYFDHDYNARGDEKVLQLRAELGWTGYGLFFATLECLCESGGFISRDKMQGLAFGLNVPKVEYEMFINSCLEIGLLRENEEGIYNPRIITHLAYRQKLRDAGLRGGRGNKKPPQSLPLGVLSVEESIGNDSKVEGELPSNAQIIMNPQQLNDVFFGDMFVEECCMRLGADKKEFTSFLRKWVTKKEITGDFCYTRNKLRTFLLKDYETYKRVPGNNGSDARTMTKKIGEM